MQRRGGRNTWAAGHTQLGSWGWEKGVRQADRQAGPGAPSQLGPDPHRAGATRESDHRRCCRDTAPTTHVVGGLVSSQGANGVALGSRA